MIIISGTGRAGTTFLVELLAKLGFDAGTWNEGNYSPIANAGLERNVLKAGGYQVVKSPHFCDQVDDAVRAGIKIDHVIVPVRKIEDAAASRARVQEAATGARDGRGVPGGLWGTTSADEQVEVLTRKFANLIEALVRNDIPTTMVSFPRIATDADYLFEKLSPLVQHVGREEFRHVFSEVAKPERINFI